MNKAFSVFIMDVTNSSNFQNGLELTNYLSFWENTLNNMHELFGIRAKHRFGDEIICVADDHYTALMIAYYMIYNWKYKGFMPYFGISLGEREEGEEILNLDTWNHSAIKRARQANEKIKLDDNRESLIFIDLPQDYFPPAIDLNLIFTMQTNFIKNQTDKQREILGLYSLLESQKKIADILAKKPPTISNHFKKGNIEIIKKTSENILLYFRIAQAKWSLEVNGLIHENLDSLNKKYAEIDKKVKEYLFDKLQQNDGGYGNWEN